MHEDAQLVLVEAVARHQRHLFLNLEPHQDWPDHLEHPFRNFVSKKVITNIKEREHSFQDKHG